MPHTPLPELGRRAKDASRALATASTSTKDAALHAAADLLVARSAEILDANTADVDRAEAAGVSATVVDRLRLTAKRIEAMADGLRMVAALPDPVGEITEGWTRPNGLVIEKVRVPLGVVAIIYENRPNVTSDAFGLCLKAGNAAFLRGSSGGHLVQHRHRRRPAGGRGQGRPARGLPHPGGGHVATRRRPSSCSSGTTSTASSPGAGRRSSPASWPTPPSPT